MERKGRENVTNLEQTPALLTMGDQSNGSGRERVMGLAALPASALVSGGELSKILDISTRTLRRMVACGQVPQGLKLGGKRIWMAGKVVEYLAAESDRLAREAQLCARRFAAEG